MIVTYLLTLTLLGIPSFGGDVVARVEVQTLEGCRALRRAVWSQLEQGGQRYTLTECEDLHRLTMEEPATVPLDGILEK